MPPGETWALAAIAACDPEHAPGDVEALVLAYGPDYYLRPDQRVPAHDWRYCGWICGRGWGKTLVIAAEINRRVEAGEARHVGLMAPTEDRVDEVQLQNLIDTAPPWFRPERHRAGLRWPNGVRAVTFTPEAPGRSRSENLDTTWLCEIVDWQATTRAEAFDNITTATRVGRAQVFWDTTSKGRNDVIRRLEELHALDARTYPILRGTLFDNPILRAPYVAAEVQKYSGRRYQEELLGRVFAESEGALWAQQWIDEHRVDVAPSDPDLTLVSIDPALSTYATADETGLLVGCVRDDHAYVLSDHSGRLSPEAWGDIAIRACLEGAAGCVIERNHLGDNATYVLRSRAKNHGLQVRTLDKGRPFPRRTPGVVWVREIVSTSSKATRASGPAAETEAGRVHLVGVHDDLEFELTTYVPGASRSPNRYDALAHLVTELLGLGREHDPVAGRVTSAAREQLRRARVEPVGAAPLVRGRGRLGI